ncbi:xanthine dehydrogenase YagS FAD-binding subunit [Murinocardiopsis flavida]|uniref:Xanthine dehydrogenase YagS FAD-binding subunit n=1 Tax=Murinocardiopsis flavida TaxID=645275 RepID=A0A2P8CVE5_9ACTN|nr:FAD binding domain-containing protein [Murinocardiopsis flavida]PSK88935.1 xanthine dehydrogenase YagS FAD-binding subunit [Murinocardiopsis flavida]
MTTTIPTDIAEAAAALRENGGEARAGGTDVMARANAGLAAGPFTDLARVRALGGIAWGADGGARIGATATIAEIASDPLLAAAYPALTATARALATPQVRAVGTLGGNLLQRNRCWYFRNPAFSCHQDGGDGCPARAGDHRNGTVFDTAPCVAPHPSSMALALLVYDAEVVVAGADGAESAPRPARDLYDAADPTRDHVLAPGELLTGVLLPPPSPGETAAYRRATARSRAEWPLVEAVARVVREDGAVTRVAVAAGGVARTPMRLAAVEDALSDGPAPSDAADAVAGIPGQCTPLPGTAHKAELMRGTVLDVLERALA